MFNNSACSATIESDIAWLRQLVRLEVQHNWLDLESDRLASLNEQGYIVFPQGQEVKHLQQRIVIPEDVKGYPVQGLSLRLVLTWWAADAQIFINDQLVQQGDLFDSSARVLITDNAQPGTEYLVKIRLVSPNHDIGALMRSHLIYEQPHDWSTDPGMIADEITVLSKYLTQFQPEQLDQLAAVLEQFDRDSLNDLASFKQNLRQLRTSLLTLAEDIKQRRFNLLGHAHLDMAWLWTTEETYEVAERTFRSVLDLQQDFPSLTFGHTTPALYQWFECHRPELFTAIKQAVKANQWEILGGMWIEPETNLVSGESLIRQLIYGQQYYQDSFDRMASVAWLPDSFGFTWQLPQIMQQCGIEYFVTGKLHWNDTTKFPHGCFWWESPDGSRMLTLMSPPNVTGVMDTNPITMVNYALDWEVQTGLQEIFWLPGVGDHGGGPTRDMLEVASKWERSPFFPRIEFATASGYLEKVENNRQDFPVWKDELYLELHRGCYTVHADQKLYNRRCERLLYEAELWCSLATWVFRDRFELQPLFPSIKNLAAKVDFSPKSWQELIRFAWKQVLFNQFHDILPGTSIREVFVEANRDWQQAIAIGEALLGKALEFIVAEIELSTAPQEDAIPVVVFNSLNWMRSQVVTIEDASLKDFKSNLAIYDDKQVKIGSGYYLGNNKISWLAKDVPGVGYRLFWLCTELDIIKGDRNMAVAEDYEIRNEYLKVIVNPQTGNLDSIYDLIAEREILSAQGNELQLFEDKGQYWDAWNIDPDYEQKRLPAAELESIERIDTGLSQVIRVVKTFNQSRFIQEYVLETNSSMLKIVNQVDWQETHVMVKAAFPLTLRSDLVTYEIPCGVIERPTMPQTEAEKAKWEVPALNWADLTDVKADYGVSLINDCKYGYDASPSCLRLTLLRAATWPDPQSDRGIHHFTYTIYPHRHSWREANTVQKGYELNTPVQTVILDRLKNNNTGTNQLPTVSQLLNLSAENLILMALQTSDKPNGQGVSPDRRLPTTGDAEASRASLRNLTLRCYEALGMEADLQIQSDLNLALDRQIDCLGREQLTEQPINLVQPYKITSYELKQNRTSAD